MIHTEMKLSNVSEVAQGEAAASKRINDLIRRANVPVMTVKNTEEPFSVRYEAIKHNIDDIVRDGYGGDMYMYIFNLAETINRLENALISVLAREETADVYDA